MAGKVAIVTGSNKGIGFAIVRELCKRGVGTVYLTARDVTRGKQAVEALNKEGFKPEFHQLEVTDKNSVKKFADHLKQKHGGIDILINNAAVATEDFLKTTYEDSVRVLNTNYRSLLIIEEYLYPLLKDYARVVNISSDCGHISNLNNSYWIERLTKKDIQLEDINAFVDWFLDSVKNGTLNENDFKGTNILAYRISKIAVCALTIVQQNKVGKNISVNSIHPGFVQTDMTGNKGQLSMEESAQAPVYVALDVDQSVKGAYFWFDKTQKNWADPKAELHVNREELMRYMKEINFWGDK
ncbi:short chain dehydrogenase domain-containing protein [Phthorimaea operculella]|nr:short chain dehydrogenase domain-containing protein [Phthorimaea operculella]